MCVCVCVYLSGKKVIILKHVLKVPEFYRDLMTYQTVIVTLRVKRTFSKIQKCIGNQNTKSWAVLMCNIVHSV